MLTKNFLQNELNSCTKCNLHEKRIGSPVHYRGNRNSPVMLIGEALGEHEERQRLPFVGPAGKKLEEWLNWIGYTIDQLFVTNVCLCRPVAPKTSRKKNITPSLIQLNTCRDTYLIPTIDQLNPRLIILCGKTPAVALNILTLATPITSYFGTQKIISSQRSIFFLRHPASLLYARNSPRYKDLRNEYIMCFLKLKELFNSLNL